jgi:hypothetical protein
MDDDDHHIEEHEQRLKNVECARMYEMTEELKMLV